MDKADYLRLLCDASVCDSTKCTQCSTERQKARGRPPKHYHPLLEKENELNIKVHNILPKSLADALCPKGSRLSHLYELPRTHKPELSMRPILSETGTYNYPLAKWLEEKLKPLSTNAYTISDIFQFSQDIRNTSIDVDLILVSYDVTALFTNVPAHETITILVEKAFSGNCFNDTYDLNLTKDQLRKLLELATTKQLFQLNGTLYEQVKGVAMVSPLGPLLANTFMCSIEEKLEENNELPSFYKRYEDDTLAIMPDHNEANAFLDKLNACQGNIKFTMEIAEQNTIPFVGMNITKSGNRLETSVYRKSTNTGLLLHYHSHVDKRYKDFLLTTMIHRAYQLSSTPTAFSVECNKLRSTFLNLDYPINLINSAIN